ncbi:MAG: DUF1553 domain-containing protein [Planctomycetaceae bacterium]|nr:DUF1553 domain-containing protein [Planctomycetaceae bacterium]
MSAMKHCLLVSISLFTLLLDGQSQSVSAADSPIVFNRDIRPILNDRCLACHGPDEKQRQADLRLDVRKLAVEAAIVPGQSAKSDLIARITSQDADIQMPPADSKQKPLSKDEIDLLRRWIDEGAKYQTHWAFIAPERPVAPAIQNKNWGRNPIDSFVLANLEKEGLTPSGEADRPTLIRRASLDLTGLPPSPQAVKEFVNDTSANAWEKAIERLLKSERYGEHLARYWLDAARYADTNGYQYDLEREQWVWRDWLIHAFNSNMPFDQFTIEQLAGDLLPNATDQQRLATAFHRNHPITIEGGVIDEEYRTEYVIDRVVTTSTVWMGMTMVCGRCHDHKYDPISQKEFYQFFAFFNQVPERGNNGFAPKINVASPLTTRRQQRINNQIAEAEQRLKKHPALSEKKLIEWERRLTNVVTNQWSVVVPATRVSQGGATLEVQADKSILATGKNPATETYELILQPNTSAVHAIRLEALKHPSFVGGGTGRGSNGNFVLSEIEFAAATKSTPDKFEPVKVASAEADYSQANYNIKLAIDGKIDRTGWAVDGNTKFEDRVAVFTFAKPLLADDVAQLRIRLHHRYGGSHHIGRFRLAIAAQPVQEVPPDVAGIVQTAAANRTTAQRERLTEVLLERFGPKEVQAATANLRSLRNQRAALTRTPATMVMTDRAAPRTTHVLYRGEYDKPREEVTSGVPAVFPSLPDGIPANRLALARWLVSANHPLTARVTVNRYWQQLFCTGMVKTTEDFGSQGEYPVHPELLDWLAVEFVKSGWDVKGLLKKMMLSATYRQSSRVTKESYERDPDNRLLARGPGYRLDAEVIRDSALKVSGLLVDRLGGPSVFPYHPPGLWQEINNRPGYSRTYKQDANENIYRRSLYTFWKRTVPPPSMATFDAPQREYCVVRRSRTNTPLQAFVMLHDPQFVEAARQLGKRMMTEGGKTVDDRIAYGFQLCTARRPNAAERTVLKQMFDKRLRQYQADKKSAARLLSVGDSPTDETLDAAEFAAWATIGRVLLNLSEFVTKG